MVNMRETHSVSQKLFGVCLCVKNRKQWQIVAVVVAVTASTAVKVYSLGFHSVNQKINFLLQHKYHAHTSGKWIAMLMYWCMCLCLCVCIAHIILIFLHRRRIIHTWFELIMIEMCLVK